MRDFTFDCRAYVTITVKAETEEEAWEALEEAMAEVQNECDGAAILPDVHGARLGDYTVGFNDRHPDLIRVDGVDQ